MIYYVSAVVNGILEQEKIKAVSEKQAWFLFCKKHGFKIRDFKVMFADKPKVNQNVKQLCFFE